MKLTNTQLKRIIKEEVNIFLQENENTLNLKKFAMLMLMLDTEKDGSSFGALLKRIESGDTSSDIFNVYLKNFKELVLKYFDMKYNGPDLKGDINVISKIADLMKQWKEIDNLDILGQKRIMAMAFTYLPSLSPIK